MFGVCRVYSCVTNGEVADCAAHLGVSVRQVQHEVGGVHPVRKAAWVVCVFYFKLVSRAWVVYMF